MHIAEAQLNESWQELQCRQLQFLLVWVFKNANQDCAIHYSAVCDRLFYLIVHFILPGCVCAITMINAVLS